MKAQHRFNRRLAIGYSIALQLVLAPALVFGEPITFLDDFSQHSLRYTLVKSNTEEIQNTYDVKSDRLEMKTVQTMDIAPDARVRVWGQSDSFSARVSLSDESDTGPEGGARALMGISGSLYNDIQDRGIEGGLGDIRYLIEIRKHGDGSHSAIYCFWRNLGNDSQEDFNIVDGSSCGDFSGFVPQVDTEYTLSVVVDRQAQEITVGLNNIKRSFTIETPLFLPAWEWNNIRTRVDGGSGTAVASVFAISTDDFTHDFKQEPPYFGPYRPFWDIEKDVRSVVTTMDGRARFDVVSTGPQEPLYVAVDDEIESIRADIELSKESLIAPESQAEQQSYVQIRLGGTFYNDIADGGVNGKEGDVFAGIALRISADGDPILSYCVFRSNNADFTDTVNLINPGEQSCPDFGIVPEFDKQYSAAIQLDSNTGKLIFTLEGVERIVDIATSVYAPEDQFVGLQARSSGGSKVVAFADNFGTIDPPSIPEPTEVASDPANNASPGGGGCNIGDTDDPTLILLLLAAAGVLLRRRLFVSENAA